MKKQRLVIPHEHGGWAMVSVPFLLGMFVINPWWVHIPLFLAWFFLYLATYPLLQAVKRKSSRKSLIKWAMAYGSVAALCIIVPLVQFPELFYFAPVFIFLFSINIAYVIRRKERSLINDCSAILIFSLGAAAAYLVGGGGWDKTMVVLVLFSFMHFMGSAFFVKTLFRERENKRWHIYSKIYHIGILLVPILIGFLGMVVPYIFSTIKAFVYGGKPMKPSRAGIIEIIGVVQFLILSLLFLN
ncbi:YwiC-like family protein [Bacillus horti]|uniref:YwiC-like family protein n=1 Tax=Caldalkalibacillus horti TaxID=77523 RepID=A0ABT9W2Y3_9BACI|nr:YwiC-like family protein [Bacillus horti]MDQ0167432.1 hypothetical protein [Bacillus horti]